MQDGDLRRRTAAAPPGEGGDDSSVDPLQPWSWAVQ